MVSLHADTNNELHQEFASQGDDSQYLNISEVANLAPPLNQNVEDGSIDRNARR